MDITSERQRVGTMPDFRKTDCFEEWLEKLNDKRAVQRIRARILLAENGDFSDCKSVGDGVSEMRIHYGTGYRLYYCQRGKQVYLLLIGAKKNTEKLQTQDIKRAKAIKREAEETNRW